MDEWQIARQYEYAIKEVEWPGGGKIFRQVMAIPYDDTATLETNSPPLCLIRIGSSTQKTSRRKFHTCSIEITPIWSQDGDKTGRNLLMSSSSILAGQRQLLDLIGKMSESQGVSYNSIIKSAAAATPLNDQSLRGVGFRTYTLEAYSTEQRTYQRPLWFRLVSNSGGNVSLGWDLPVRFDFFKFVLRRQSGTPPSSISSGVSVALSTPTSITVSEAGVPSGTWWYGLFAGYDDDLLGDELLLNYSPPSYFRVVVP